MAILHVPLDALLPFAYPDNFQVTWLRLRRSLRWGTWGRQPFSGATKGGDYAKSKYIEALLTVVNRISLAKAFDNCKISVEQISTMVLRVTAARQAFPGAELNCGDQYYWTIPAILSPSTPGFKSCSASRLSRFYSKSLIARLVNRLQRCKSAYSSGRFWKLSSKTQFPFWSKFKPIPATFINIIQVWQFRLPLLLPQGPGPLPSSPALHVTEGKGALKENEAAHEAKMYHV